MGDDMVAQEGLTVCGEKLNLDKNVYKNPLIINSIGQYITTIRGTGTQGAWNYTEETWHHRHRLTQVQNYVTRVVLQGFRGCLPADPLAANDYVPLTRAGLNRWWWWLLISRQQARWWKTNRGSHTSQQVWARRKVSQQGWPPSNAPMLFHPQAW